MKLYIFLIACLSLVASGAYAGSVALPKPGTAPTAAGMGVTTSITNGAATTNPRNVSTSTSAGFGNPTANAFGNSASTSGTVARAPAAALTTASGVSGTGAAAAVGVGNVSHGATTKP